MNTSSGYCRRNEHRRCPTHHYVNGTQKVPCECKCHSTALQTKDGRYIVVRRRLWRKSNPNLSAETRQQLVNELMTQRRNKRRAIKLGDSKLHAETKHKINEVKIALGERGPVWWDDGQPDYTRKMLYSTPYTMDMLCPL